MKRLLFSDLHLNKWSYGASVTKEGFNSRLWQQWLAAKEMIDYAEDNAIEYVYFTGDLFHTHGTISTEALNIACKIFDEFRKRGIKIRAIPGNHDMADKQGSIHSLSFLPPEETCGQWVDGGLDVYSMPYTQDEEALKRFLGGVGEGDGGMVLLHQGVAGVPLSSGYLLDEKLNPEMIPENSVAFTGHYHFHRVVTPRLTVVGNLISLNWNDIDQIKGWVVWDDETGSVEQICHKDSVLFMSWDNKLEKHSDLSNVNGAFVRYTVPVKPMEMTEIRAQLTKAGALAVQFSSWQSEKVSKTLKTNDKLTIDHIVDQFDESTKGRRREVGSELRENNYNASVEV